MDRFKTNTETAKRINITPVLDKIQEYKRKCLQHINRMPRYRLPRILKNYRQTGRRNQGGFPDALYRNGAARGPTPLLVS